MCRQFLLEAYEALNSTGPPWSCIYRLKYLYSEKHALISCRTSLLESMGDNCGKDVDLHLRASFWGHRYRGWYWQCMPDSDIYSNYHISRAIRHLCKVSRAMVTELKAKLWLFRIKNKEFFWRLWGNRFGIFQNDKRNSESSQRTYTLKRRCAGFPV